MTVTKDWPQNFKDIKGILVRHNPTHAMIDYPGSPKGEPASFKMSELVAKFINKIPPGPVTFSYSKDEHGSRTLTYIKADGEQPAGGQVKNEETGGQVPSTSPSPEPDGSKVSNSDWSIGGITRNNRLIVLQTCLKVAGDMYAGIPDRDMNKAPQVVTEWAIYMARGIIAEAMKG